MSAAREACSNCQLPFYTDRNETCPYCGTPTPGMESSGERPAADATAGDTAAGGAGEATGHEGDVDTTPAGSVARDSPPSRPRVACSNCGLPHYADDHNGCPYCATAGVEPAHGGKGSTAADDGTPAEPAAPKTSTGAAAGGADGSAEEAETGSGSGGLLSRLRGLFGG